MKANVGDYIITGVKGEQYPCKPEIFEQTYEVVTNNTDVVLKSESLPLDVHEALKQQAVEKAKVELAREIFKEIGKILYKYDKIAERDKSEYGELIVGDIGSAIAELKQKRVVEVPIVRDLAEEAVDKDIQNHLEK